jgi:hypothetical protein
MTQKQIYQNRTVIARLSSFSVPLHFKPQVVEIAQGIKNWLTLEEVTCQLISR